MREGKRRKGEELGRKQHVYHGRSAQPKPRDTSQCVQLKGALRHSGQVFYVQNTDWTNDLRFLGVGVWVSVWV